MPVVAGADKVLTGPATEQRFPPLKVPDGFRATLFACDPLIEYPSVIAIGPRAGTLFVAYDYMTGLGLEIVRRDEIRLVRDTDGDGYADATTLYAADFHSIQGLAFHAGYVYVMHAPFLTRLKDSSGDDVADERLDLLGGLGLPPEENPNRLHCANGVVVGHDGWLYLALGDRGCDVLRPEGDRLVVREGGILRCRPDGRDLHVFSRGLRNIYDVALDEELNVFVRDNENDGGDYMIRVCHCFHGSDHGYPYLYNERPEESLPPLADLGRGSSAGGTAYLESAFPEEYRHSLYFCEWGRAVVRYPRLRAASGFAPMREVDFAVTPPQDPYGFKPTDLVVDRDGSLLISDWCDGQRPKRGRGRIYRVSAIGKELGAEPRNEFANPDRDKLVHGLNSNRYHVRVTAQGAVEQQGPAGVRLIHEALQLGQLNVLGRLHAIWVLARAGGRDAIDGLFRLAESDDDPHVRAQSVRALADLTDPILVTHRIDAGRGDPEVGRRLARIAESADPRVQLEITIALRRLQWSEGPAWIRRHGNLADPVLAHAGMMLLRRCENWPDVLQLLDEPRGSVARTLAVRALANQSQPTIADGLLERLRSEPDPRSRREYVDLLARMYKRPADWTYWGFRPAPRAANTVVWEQTAAIAAALDRALSDSEASVRTLALQRMAREQVPIRLESIAAWLQQQPTPAEVTAILDVLTTRADKNDVRSLLAIIFRDAAQVTDHRLRALEKYLADLDGASEPQLLELARELDEGSVLAGVLREFGRRPGIDGSRLLLNWLESQNADVRAAAAASLADRPVGDAAEQAGRLLHDPDLRVRRAAAVLVGKLNLPVHTDRLLEFAADRDPQLRSASLDALRIVGEPRAIPLAVQALQVPESQLAALAFLAELGGPEFLSKVVAAAEKTRSVELLAATVRSLVRWHSKSQLESDDQQRIQLAIATLQGSSGSLLHWQVQGPVDSDAAKSILQESRAAAMNEGWQTTIAQGTDGQIRMPGAGVAGANWLAITDVALSQPQQVVFLASAEGAFRIWLNGQLVHERAKPAAYQPDSERFEAELPAGTSRLAVQITKRDMGNDDPILFHARFRNKSSRADHERLTQLALSRRGNIQRGRELFLNADKTQCVKCHRIADQGGRIGPDLAAIGSRFSRIHLVESLLEPSRTVAPSYETWALILDSGKVMTGVKLSETATHITLGDLQGQTVPIPKASIEESQQLPTSLMPEDLTKPLTDTEFVDLVEFLVSLTKTEP